MHAGGGVLSGEVGVSPVEEFYPDLVSTAEGHRKLDPLERALACLPVLLLSSNLQLTF